uniref:Alternative protein TTC26 n=1 Tax=Homo sapiens TaxID=9606 RepID=L8EC83_HUMAN|nr:alternative protein TTC26 [Homo sapiens]
MFMWPSATTSWITMMCLKKFWLFTFSKFLIVPSHSILKPVTIFAFTMAEQLRQNSKA